MLEPVSGALGCSYGPRLDCCNLRCAMLTMAVSDQSSPLLDWMMTFDIPQHLAVPVLKTPMPWLTALQGAHPRSESRGAGEGLRDCLVTHDVAVSCLSATCLADGRLHGILMARSGAVTLSREQPLLKVTPCPHSLSECHLLISQKQLPSVVLPRCLLQQQPQLLPVPLPAPTPALSSATACSSREPPCAKAGIAAHLTVLLHQVWAHGSSPA